MKLLLSLVLLTCLVAISARASQEEDAAALEAMFADPSFVPNDNRRSALKLDGCAATFTLEQHIFRFLVSSIDYGKWAEQSNNEFVWLNEEAIRRFFDWEDHKGSEPRPPMGFHDDDEMSAEERQRLMDMYVESTHAYVEKMRSGEFGDWFKHHHHVGYEGSAENKVPYDIRIIGGVPLRIIHSRKSEIIEALARYTLFYCLPAPMFD